MKMAQQILDYVEINQGCTFTCLERDLPGFAGNRTFGDFAKNIILWTGISQEAIDAIKQLAFSGLLEVIPASPAAYAYDGGPVPDMKIAKGFDRQYKSNRWLPLVFFQHKSNTTIGATP